MSALWGRLVFPPPKPEGWPAKDPIPEVTTRDPWPPDVPIPGPVAELERLAALHGWSTRPGYSRGPERAVRVGTYKITEVVALWAAPHATSGWRWVAEYSHTMGKPWSWRSISIWRPGQLVAPGLGVRFHEAMRTDLGHFVAVKGAVLPYWFKEIHAREEAKKAAARLAARNRPKAKKEGSS